MFVNHPPESLTLDLTRCCVPTQSNGSPIDTFYETIRHTLTLGQPDQLRDSPTLGRLLILGLVTGTEAYFRTTLFGLTSFCPLAKDSLADSEIAFGAIDFYGADQAALGLFERVSFAGKLGIKEMSKKIAGLTWVDRSSLGVAVSDFEKVCHMRHAAVHSQGVLNRGNARALGLGRSTGAMNVVVDMPHFHMAAKACTNLVREYNRSLYEHIVQRWIRERILVGRWSDDRKFFQPFIDLMRSQEDGLMRGTAYSVYRTLQSGILNRYASP
ncbi:hypothetical protein SAMN05421541_102610 [Actinoplanes philippinensis]|uniref:Uncharacterized protein n=1 Tax=Actinoplanes philippinensis TaxID=35752 RepID=A0A1I2BZI4_9ACTN|nr:hypothetical protein SAMN05421541_102610 [Actinoplanes philippinensis]